MLEPAVAVALELANEVGTEPRSVVEDWVNAWSTSDIDRDGEGIKRDAERAAVATMRKLLGKETP
jgi:hypothetical protein